MEFNKNGDIKMAKGNFVLGIIVIASLAMPVLFFASPCAKEVYQDEITTIKTKVHFIGSKISITIYLMDEFFARTWFNFTDFGARDPIEAYIFIAIGYIFGIFFGNFYLMAVDTVDDQLKEKGIKRLVTKTSTYRGLTWYTTIANAIGVTGMLLFTKTVMNIKDSVPDLRFTYAYYHIIIIFFISLVYSFYRIINPKYEFRHKKGKIIDTEKAVKSITTETQVHTKMDEIEIYDTFEEEMTTKIEKLLENSKGEVSIAWLETVTQYPQEVIKEIIIKKLNFVIENEQVKKKN